MVLQNADRICTIVQSDSPAEFQRLVQDEMAVAVFMADWCLPCEKFLMTLESPQVAEYLAHLGIKPLYIDAENKVHLAVQYGIRSVPQTLVFKSGKMERRFLGSVPSEMVLSYLKEVYTQTTR